MFPVGPVVTTAQQGQESRAARSNPDPGSDPRAGGTGTPTSKGTGRLTDDWNGNDRTDFAAVVRQFNNL
jgi:hypothetical protein